MEKVFTVELDVEVFISRNVREVVLLGQALVVMSLVNSLVLLLMLGVKLFWKAIGFFLLSKAEVELARNFQVLFGLIPLSHDLVV